MPSNPKYTFWLGIIVTVCLAVGNGSLHLTHMIPESWIPTVVAWNAFIAFVGAAVMTAMAGINSSKQSIVTAAAQLPEVKTICLNPNAPATPALNQATPENVTVTGART